jgi:hypothetical protein
MTHSKSTSWSFPQDAFYFIGISLWSNVLYRIFIRPDYLLAVAWFVAGLLFVLRARQLAPIQNRIVRTIFWIIGIGILVAIWFAVVV